MAAVALLCLLPAVFLLVQLLRNWVDVPLADQWDFIDTLIRARAGQLSLHDLWAQHNEHRLIFPRLAMLALAAFSGWDVRWEMAFSFLLGLGIFAVLCYQVQRTSRLLQVDALRFALPAVSVITFSLAQSENWLWGWQLQILMSVLAAVSTVVLLGEPRLGNLRFALGIAAAVVATYSFGNGAMTWVVGFVVIALGAKERGKKETVRLLVVWSVCAALTMASYLYGYAKPTRHPSLLEVFHHPLRFIDYVFLYFGAPVIAGSQKGAFYSGIVAFLITVGSIAWLVRRKIVTLSAMAPYLGITLYVLLSASVTGFARLGFGSPQALSSRYVTIASPFWVVFVTIAILVLSQAGHARKRGGIYAIGIVALLLFGRLTFNSLRDGATSFQARHDQMQAAREGLLRGEESDAVKALYPDFGMIQSHLPALREQRLSCFRDASAP